MATRGGTNDQKVAYNTGMYSVSSFINISPI